MNNFNDKNKYKIQKKSLGQVFLVNLKTISLIAKQIDDPDINCIIEIGPGSGALTQELLKFNKDLLCVEVDNHWVNHLKQKFNQKKHFKILNEDILKLDFNELLKKTMFQNKTIGIISNLPYNIATPILFKLFNTLKNHFKQIKKLVLMFQLEVGQRILAKPNEKKYNQLSIISQIYCDVKQICISKKTDFKPVPKVDSIVIEFCPGLKIKRYDIDANYLIFIRSMFLHKRKTILNNLAKYFQEDKSKAKQILEKAAINLQKRPEELSEKDFKKIYQKFQINN